jgi:hypothetical protein
MLNCRPLPNLHIAAICKLGMQILEKNVSLRE